MLGPMLDIGGVGVFFQGTVSKERVFCLLTHPEQMPFELCCEYHLYDAFDCMLLSCHVQVLE